MRAIVLDRPGTFRVAEVPDPAPGPSEIVVKVDCCGICGTDLHILDGEFPPPLEQSGEAVNRVRSGQGIKWHTRPS